MRFSCLRDRANSQHSIAVPFGGDARVILIVAEAFLCMVVEARNGEEVAHGGPVEWRRGHRAFMNFFQKTGFRDRPGSGYFLLATCIQA